MLHARITTTTTTGPFLPPRAESVISRSLLPRFEKLGWWGQAKKNGTHTVVLVPAQGAITAINRHGEPHKAWNWTSESLAGFERVRPREGASLFDAELLHSKGVGYRDTHYVFDVLCHEGRILFGTTYAQRYKIMQEVFLRGDEKSEPSHWVLQGGRHWLARNFRDSFQTRWDAMRDEPADEGLMLKDPGGVYTSRDVSKAPWMIRCRHAHKNFAQ